MQNSESAGYTENERMWSQPKAVATDDTFSPEEVARGLCKTGSVLMAVGVWVGMLAVIAGFVALVVGSADGNASGTMLGISLLVGGISWVVTGVIAEKCFHGFGNMLKVMIDIRKNTERS